MVELKQVIDYLEQFAPTQFAEEWDNVGLLVGRRVRDVQRIMTCLTVTPASAAEAIERGADLIVTHHPMPFFAMKRWTDETTAGRLLLDLVSANVAVYSPHTAFDSAARGINQRLAEGLELRDITPIRPIPDGPGVGRWGRVDGELSLRELATRLKQFLRIERLHLVGSPDTPVRTVGIGCGAAEEFLASAAQCGCDAMVLGEARFHACLEAEALGIALLLPGHYASERFAVEELAKLLAEQFPALQVWASQRECDPLGWDEG